MEADGLESLLDSVDRCARLFAPVVLCVLFAHFCACIVRDFVHGKTQRRSDTMFPLQEEFVDRATKSGVPCHTAVGWSDSRTVHPDAHMGNRRSQRSVCQARGRKNTTPTQSAQSTGKVNPGAPGWTKRLRLGSALLDRTPCPSRMSVLEKSIRQYAEAFYVCD